MNSEIFHFPFIILIHLALFKDPWIIYPLMFSMAINSGCNLDIFIAKVQAKDISFQKLTSKILNYEIRSHIKFSDHNVIFISILYIIGNQLVQRLPTFSLPQNLLRSKNFLMSFFDSYFIPNENSRHIFSDRAEMFYSDQSF